MNEDLIVAVSEGKLCGKICKNYNGRSYYSFQGIPYAKPPLGKLRFKPPQPPDRWTGVRDATQEGPQCYSKNLITNVIEGSEDCLFLNVYTPKIDGKELLSVMFWIHGGAFTMGSGGTEIFGPDYLVDKNVVLVTINYRLGPLGFLAFSNPSIGVTGNAGLKDMVMALKWVQTNIKRFCGDPNNVTIFGESAGGASVHYLILSPMAKGLFHKAIIQSGCALNPFTRSRCSYTHQLALKLGIDNNDDRFILSELRKVPVQELVKASRQIWDPYLISNMRPFGPVIEPKTNEPGFLTEEPLDIIKSGRYNKVPMIMGYNTLEGVFVYNLMKTSDKHFLSDATLVPHMLNLRIGGAPYKTVAERIKKMYGITGNESLKVDLDIEKALKVYTHNFFMIDICRSAMLHVKNNKHPVYFYRFDLDTDLNFMKRLCKTKTEGAAHADDLPYLFNTILMPPPEKDTLEYKLIQKLTSLWTNFAKYGNPTHESEIIWKPTAPDSFNYLHLKNDCLQVLQDPEKEFVDFWVKLYGENQVHLSKL